MREDSPFKCPVCRAGFRGTPECSRCGADLRPLMIIIHNAFLARNEARAAIRRGEFTEALNLVTKAQTLQNTEAGRTLYLLTSWLNIPQSGNDKIRQ